MTIDIYTATGTKKGTMELPPSLFEQPVNHGLIHQALVRQQSNRRNAIAHVKNRSEVQGSTRKLFQQKGTGRARRGSVRSPLLKGGGKAFGPRSNANFTKRMPRSMSHAAVRSCLSLQARSGAILAIESYPETIKTKSVVALLKKLPLDMGRKTLLVVPQSHRALMLSVRNIPFAKTVVASYLNPEDLLRSRHIIFIADAVAKAEAIFGKSPTTPKSPRSPKSEQPKATTKKPSALKKTSIKKKPSASSASSDSSASS